MDKQNGPGRPKKQINWEQAEKLAYLQCTREEMAGFFGCTPKTFAVRLKEHTEGLSFEEWFSIYGSNGKISLRREQMKLAEKGNATMLVWLGKQYLGQTDKVESRKEEDAFAIPDTLKADDDHKEESEAGPSLQ